MQEEWVRRSGLLCTFRTDSGSGCGEAEMDATVQQNLFSLIFRVIRVK